MTPGPWRFGVEPLDQTVRLARLMRRVAGLTLSLEQEHLAVARLIEELERADQVLSPEAPADARPRVGPDAIGDGRVYLDHSRVIGAFNPCFPEYTIEVHGDRATGTVTFPIAYEGPPGIVHGGFLAVFFDCVIQEHNCELGQTGKTASLHVSFHRPVPLLTELAFQVDRTVSDRRITSAARLMLDGTILCDTTVHAAQGDRSRLPAVSPRRRSG